MAKSSGMSFQHIKKIGGAPLNVAIRLKSLGNEVYIVSKVGNDENGAQLIDFIKSNEVSTDFIQVDENYETGTVIAVGPAAYEFSMADNPTNTNPWQSNVDLFTTNTLSYLRSLTQALNIDDVIKNSVTFYPNPVQNELFITKRNIDNLKLNLYDVNGRVLIKNQLINDNSPVDLSGLNGGIFFAEIMNKVI